MLSPPLVSVVMAVCNGEEYVGEALDSILGQSFQDFECIVINDGSVDNTAGILQENARLDQRLFVFHQENQGLIAALNRGCRLARGKYIARMDADDVSAPDRFAMQVDFLDRHSMVAALGGAIKLINAKSELIGEHHYPLDDRQIKEALGENNCSLAHPTVMMRKCAFDTTGGYRRSFLHAEDYDLWLRMAERFEFANLPDVLLYYRIHARQISTQHIRQQVLSTVAARAAARIRRETGQDPVLPPDGVNADALANLAVTRKGVVTELIRRHLLLASSMRVVGEYGLAEKFLRDALVLSHAEATTDLRHDIHVEFAKCQFLQRNPTRALISLFKAVALRPAAASSIIRYGRLAFRGWQIQTHHREL